MEDFTFRFDMLFHGHVLIEISTQISHTISCMCYIAHDVNRHVSAIRIYSVLESLIFSFMLCIQLLISLMHRSIDSVTIHRIRVETTVYLMVISVGMSQFPMLINDIENWATVFREFNRT